MNLQAIKSLSLGESVRDDKVKGLFAHRNANSITFYLQFRTREQRQRKMKLGRYGVLTLEDARKMAQSILAKVAAGEDPVAKWQAAREELTVGELMLKALKEYWGQERFIESRHFFSVLSGVKNDFGAIIKYKLSDLRPSIVDRWHKSFHERPTHGNHLLSYLIKAINWAIENKLTDIKNPCLSIKKFPKVKRNRYATADEIKKIGHFLEDNFRRDPYRSLYLYLILTTGTRPSAIPRLMWKNLIIKKNAEGKEVGVISFYGKTTAKTGEEETLIIPPKTLAMIKKIPQTSEYILPINMPQKLWEQIKKKFNCHDLWARDLRRTYATVGLSGGVSLSEVGELLNHKCWDTTKIYAKLMMNKRIESAMAVAKNLENIIGN